MNASSAQDRYQRWLLVGLALAFFAPLGAAFYLYYGHSGLAPSQRVNSGVLVDPPRPLPARVLSLAGKWTLLYWAEGRCAARCRAALYKTRQVRWSLDRDRDRVQRIFLASGECCDWPLLKTQHPDLLTVRADLHSNSLLDLMPEVGVAPQFAGRTYLVDPLGNLMMYYRDDAPPEGMLEDLQRLLKFSHIG